MCDWLRRTRDEGTYWCVGGGAGSQQKHHGRLGHRTCVSTPCLEDKERGGIVCDNLPGRRVVVVIVVLFTFISYLDCSYYTTHEKGNIWERKITLCWQRPKKKTFYLSVTCRENKRKRWKHLFLSLKSVSKVWPQAQLWALDCFCRSILPLVRVFWSPLVLIYQRATTQCFYTCQCFVK